MLANKHTPDPINDDTTAVLPNGNAIRSVKLPKKAWSNNMRFTSSS